jgi:hypothetical protein
LIANGDITEAGGDVHRQGLVALLETVVLLDVVQVVSSDNASPRWVKHVRYGIVDVNDSLI